MVFTDSTMKQFTILLLTFILLSTIMTVVEAAPSRQVRYIKGPAASSDVANKINSQMSASECDCPGVYCGPGCTCCVA
ncbi:unnamed protein product [Adineta steineri]|uniref:Uncharacterized protein n=2 Tax=Adineta steineri TaxID=433720 RepID=A0A815XC02_9BILA|nr:unnamed protein product [Adineta steineri]